MTLHHPESLDAALSLLSGTDAVVLAGGTDLYPSLRDGAPPTVMVDVSGISGLRGITHEDTGWRIGAATTWTDILVADLPALFDGLKAAAHEVGSVQIQNTGTVAGNLCNASPAADGVPALMALDAEVELVSPEGTRQLPLAKFITGPRKTELQPGELVSAILVPKAAGSGAFLKLGARKYLVISIAMTSAVIETEANQITRARLSVGACSPVALRFADLEAALIGATVKTVGDIVAASELLGIAPIDDVRASGLYRTGALRTLLTRTILKAMENSDVA